MKSTSASPNQPIATKALYQFDSYTGKTGKRSLSVRLNVRDMAQFYAEQDSQAGGYEDGWSTVYSNPYFSERIYNADCALKAIAGFTFPADIKQAAQRAARMLTEVFEQVSKLQTVHNLTSGKLDRSKFKSIAQHTAAGTYDNDVVRPYKRTQPTPAVLPTIAIVASAGNAEMWNDETYIPRVLTLALGVLWACQAANLPTYAALTKGHCYIEAVQAHMLATPDSTISPKVYGVALHRDLWRYGEMTCQAADTENDNRLSPHNGYVSGIGKKTIGMRFPSRNGGQAVQWAREILKADIVIAIGNITDKSDADIQLDSSFTLEQAIKSIAQQASKL